MKQKSAHCKSLYETICNEFYYPAFYIDNLKRISITLHSSKGLEFEQVILFISDYKLSKEQDNNIIIMLQLHEQNLN